MKKENLRISVIVVMIFIFIFLLFGVTYSLYRNILQGTTNNVIKTGIIRFSYDEDISNTGGINLTNALPIDDEIGKIMNATYQYFDFSVSCTTTLADVNYEIILQKVGTNTLADRHVKIYLTKLTGGNEYVVNSTIDNSGVVKTFASFNNDDSVDSKIIHIDTVKKGTENLVQKYRLRMWIGEGDYTLDEVYGKNFSVVVKVKASE